MLGYGDGIILGSNDGEILVSTLGAADRNKIGIDERTDLGSPDGFGLLDGNELGWFVEVSYISTHLPHSEQSSSSRISLSLYRLHQNYVGEYMSHGPYPASKIPFQVILVRRKRNIKNVLLRWIVIKIQPYICGSFNRENLLNQVSGNSGA